MSDRSETFNSFHVQSAIRDFLEYGEGERGKSHQGYFSGSGWAARCLRWHLEKLREANPQEAPSPRVAGLIDEFLRKTEPLRQEAYATAASACREVIDEQLPGPAPVDDPAPYRTGAPRYSRLYRFPGKKVRMYTEDPRGEFVHREEYEALLGEVEDAELRLSVAAQMMAAYISSSSVAGTDRDDAVLAMQSLRRADALIAKWKETT